MRIRIVRTRNSLSTKSPTLVGKKVLKDERNKNSIKFVFDNGSIFEVRRRSGPDADHMGWSNTVEVLLNGKKVLEEDA